MEGPSSVQALPKVDIYVYCQGEPVDFENKSIIIKFDKSGSTYSVLIPKNINIENPKRCQLEKQIEGGEGKKGSSLIVTMDKVHDFFFWVLTQGSVETSVAIEFEAKVDLEPGKKYAIILRSEGGLISASFIKGKLPCRKDILQKREKIEKMIVFLRDLGRELLRLEQERGVGVDSANIIKISRAYLNTCELISTQLKNNEFDHLNPKEICQIIVSCFQVSLGSKLKSSVQPDLPALSQETDDEVKNKFIRVKTALEKMQSTANKDLPSMSTEERKSFGNIVGTFSARLRQLAEELKRRNLVVEGSLTGLAAPLNDQYEQHIIDIFNKVFND